ncbi:MFS transporter [Catellatospora sichuanensis]|uniref:MFS transporter n=1 Tax=Catellatospora sichuanensis TaxID=1969805 RepID=UPI001183FB98|nr:MFS transporter [Catellatospora sichuanensis]
MAALLALAVGAFCYVAMETMPIGLLPLISEDLGVSLADAGLLVTGYGLTVAIVSVPLAYLTRRVPRRLLFSVLLAVFVVATLASAIAENYAVLLGARVVVALSQAVFWGVVGPAAAGLFSVEVRGRATATVFGGGAIAPMLGVPAGTWLGQQVGWRWTFVALAAVGLVTLLLLAVLMPSVPVGQGHAATGTAPSVRRFWILIAVTTLSITGLFTAFTYTTPFLTDVAGFPVAAISPLLLLRGVVDFGGIAVAGVFVDRRPRAVMAGSVAVMAVSLTGMYAFAGVQIATAAALALSGFALGALTPALQNRVLEVAPGNSDLASAGNSAAFNVGIAGGAFLGGAVLSDFGLAPTALVGGLVATVALLLVLTEPLIAPAGSRHPAADGTQPARKPDVLVREGS